MGGACLRAQLRQAVLAVLAPLVVLFNTRICRGQEVEPVLPPPLNTFYS